MTSHSLIARVRRGELNFERFIGILTSRGYITEFDKEEGCCFGSSAMEAARQDHFDALFVVLMPDVLNDIELSKVAVRCEGPGAAYEYALFNKNVIDEDAVRSILKRLV